MQRTIVVNALAGPGAGKSTLSYGLIALLKARGEKAEFVGEFAKELVYRRDFVRLADQFAVTREQDRRLRDLIGQVDFIVHDSALPLGLIYPADGPYTEDWFVRRTWEMYEGYRNFNVFVKRVKKFEQYGRQQDEATSRMLDQRIFDLFGADRIDLIVEGVEGNEKTVYEALMKLDR